MIIANKRIYIGDGQPFSDNTNHICNFMCDDTSDIAGLPTACLPGSSAYVIDTGEKYIINGAGVWVRSTAAEESYLCDMRGELPHIMTVEGAVTVKVVSVGGWDLYEPKNLGDGAWVYNGWKLKLTVSSGVTVTVNGTEIALTDNVGLYHVGMHDNVNIVVTTDITRAYASATTGPSGDYETNDAAVTSITETDNVVTVLGDGDSMTPFAGPGNIQGNWVTILLVTNIPHTSDITLNGEQLTETDRDYAIAAGGTDGDILLAFDFSGGDVEYTLAAAGYTPVTITVTAEEEDEV